MALTENELNSLDKGLKKSEKMFHFALIFWLAVIVFAAKNSIERTKGTTNLRPCAGEAVGSDPRLSVTSTSPVPIKVP